MCLCCAGSAAGLTTVYSGLSPAVTGTLSNAVSCWMLWHIESIKGEPNKGLSPILQSFIDENK